MFISVFDIFKHGIGPSSSHTMGPMTAAARFLDNLRNGANKPPGADRPASVSVSLHGSLAFTGKGQLGGQGLAREPHGRGLRLAPVGIPESAVRDRDVIAEVDGSRGANPPRETQHHQLGFA